MPVRMTKEGRAETREDKRSEQANQQAVSAKAAISPSEGKGSTKAKEPKSPTERKNEKKAQIREARMTSTAKRYGERYTPGMLTGGQAKIAAKAPPPNVINEKDFEVLRAEKAKGRGMGLQDEKVKPGKVKPVKAVLGIAAMGLMGAKYLKDKNKKATPMIGGAAELMKKKKELLGKKAGGVMKAKRGKFGEAKDYKKYLKGLKKATSEVRGAKLNSPAYNITTYDQKSYERAGGKGKAVFKDYKGLGIKNEDQYFKEKNASKFMKRRKKLAGAKSLIGKGGRIGAAITGLTIAGAGAAKLGQTLGKKYDEMKKKNKKMGGGMMQKPMGYKIGTGKKPLETAMNKKRAEQTKNVKRLTTESDAYDPERRILHASKKTRSGSSNAIRSTTDQVNLKEARNKFKSELPRGYNVRIKTPEEMRPRRSVRRYSKGVMVKARGCKLGRTRPTKIT